MRLYLLATCSLILALPGSLLAEDSKALTLDELSEVVGEAEAQKIRELSKARYAQPAEGAPAQEEAPVPPTQPGAAAPKPPAKRGFFGKIFGTGQKQDQIIIMGAEPPAAPQQKPAVTHVKGDDPYFLAHQEAAAERELKAIMAKWEQVANHQKALTGRPHLSSAQAKHYVSELKLLAERYPQSEAGRKALQEAAAQNIEISKAGMR